MYGENYSFGVFMIDDDDAEAEGELVPDGPHIKRKKLMLILLPLLIVIGISATIFFVIRKQRADESEKYKIVQYSKDSQDNISVFYDLPEVVTAVKGKEGNHELRFKLNLELANIDDLRIIEILAPKLNDVIINHTIELTTDELSGSTGLYWFKEELFYRLNVAAAPIKIKNINFDSFELQQ